MYVEIFARRKFHQFCHPLSLAKIYHVKFFRGYGDLYHIGEIFFCNTKVAKFNKTFIQQNNFYTVVTLLLYLYYRVYSRFTLEAIVATAFGRQINLQRGESDEFSKAMDIAAKGLSSGQIENLILINSMHKWQSNVHYLNY